MQTRIPLKIDVIEVSGLTLIFSPEALDILVIDRADFEESYVNSNLGKSVIDSDILFDWLEPLRANGVLALFWDIGDQLTQLGWLTSADGIYHHGFGVMYVNESYAVRSVLDNILNPNRDEFSLPGTPVDAWLMDDDLTSAHYDLLQGYLSQAEYDLKVESIKAHYGVASEAAPVASSARIDVGSFVWVKEDSYDALGVVVQLSGEGWYHVRTARGVATRQALGLTPIDDKLAIVWRENRLGGQLKNLMQEHKSSSLMVAGYPLAWYDDDDQLVICDVKPGYEPYLILWLMLGTPLTRPVAK